jgi:hypothetical protein
LIFIAMDTQQQILPYAYFLIYARAHNPVWMKVCEQLRALYRDQVRRLCSSTRPTLPLETMCEVTTYLDALSLCRCATTCTAWRAMCDRIELWETLCQVEFKISMDHFQCRALRKASEGSEGDDDADGGYVDSDQKRPRTGSTGAHPKELYRLARTSLQMLLRGHTQQRNTPRATFTATNLPAIHVPLMIHS